MEQNIEVDREFLIQCEDLLKTHFGYSHLKPVQYQIIDAIINHSRDVAAFLATGYGKSLCFQLPYLLTTKSVIVISPLISLMEDQQKQLEEIGIKSCCLNSSCQNKASVKKEILDGLNQIIYITPEYLMFCEEFISKINDSGNLLMFVIDEAHCTSSYSNFRESYSELYVLRDLWPNVPILALTASATLQVRNDICTNLKLNDPLIIVSNLDRPNLYLEVNPKKIFEDKFESIIKDKKDQYMLVYCKTKKDTELLHNYLVSLNINADIYHGSIDIEKRSNVQSDFKKGTIKCLVCTNAFGMGINIPNIRTIIHYGSPSSLDSYYQEIGRGSRDGEPCECYLFFDHKDTVINSLFASEIENKVQKKYQINAAKIIEQYVHTHGCRRKLLLEYFGVPNLDYIDNCKNCDNCINLSQSTKVDCTKDAYRLLAMIASLESSWGMTMLIDIIKGSKSKKISEKVKQTQFYGCCKGTDTDYLKEVIKYLIEKIFLTEKQTTRFGGCVLKLSKKGSTWLDIISETYPNLFDSDCNIDPSHQIIIVRHNGVKISKKAKEIKEVVQSQVDIPESIDKQRDDLDIVDEYESKMLASVSKSLFKKKITPAIDTNNNDDKGVDHSIRNEGKKWTENDIIELKKYIDMHNLSLDKIAFGIGRTTSSIVNKIRELIEKLYNEHNSTDKVAKILNISKSFVEHQIPHLISDFCFESYELIRKKKN